MTYEEKIKEAEYRKEVLIEDRLDSVIWALAFIWGGLVAFSHSLGYLPDVDPWSLFFIGAGLLVIIELTVRVLVPAHRRDLLGTLLWAGFMFLLGGWSFFWPFFLVAVGAYILLSSYLRSTEI